MAAKWEENVARRVSEAGLPVPAVYGIVEVDGRHGIIYERVDGPSMLEEIISKPGEIENFANMFAELHAKMHSLEVRGLPSQRRRLELKIRNAKPLSEKGRSVALKALQQLPDDNVLCHGDFHTDNILMSSRGPIVIDWMDATKGNPHADIARTLLLLNPNRDLIVDYLEQILGNLAKLDAEHVLSLISLFVDIYLRKYIQIRHTSLDDIKLWRLPVTAARLSEGIKEDESRLLSIMEKL